MNYLKRRHLGLLLGICMFVIAGGTLVLAQTSTSPVGVYYVGPEDAVAQAIDLASPHLIRVTRSELAQVVVLNDAPLTYETLHSLGQSVRQEDMGLVLFCGPQFPQDDGDLRALFGISAFGLVRTEQAMSVQVSNESDALQTAIAWSTAPQLYGRTVISNPNLLLPVVRTTTGQAVLSRLRGRANTQVFIFAPWFSDVRHAPWQSWPYFQYLVYRLIAEAAGLSRILSFAEYPLSPVPHGRVRAFLMVGGGAVMALAVMAFMFAQRYLFLHPEQLDTLRIDVAPRERLPQNLWDIVGFHRPLAGFLYVLGVGVLMGVPLLRYRTYILPSVLIPWPQVLSSWEQVTRWLMLVWLFLDMGMGVAAVRFFSMLRMRNPREGFRYFQCYVWWQLLSGALQLGAVVWLATVVFPDTALAHLSFYFIVYALLRFPGFLGIWHFIFRGFQRFDYELTLVWVRVALQILLQVIFIGGLRRLGARLPYVGPALGSVFGLGLSLYVTEWILFGLGIVFYKRMGYALKPLFLPAFDRGILLRMLGFGARLMFGAVLVSLGALVQANLLPDLLDNYALVWDNWQLALMLIWVFNLLSVGLFNSLMPAIAEAQSQGYKMLIRYYVGQGLRYGMWFGLFFLALFSSVADRFVLGFLGGTYALASQIVGPLLVWVMLQWPSWVAERTLEAAGRPALVSWLRIGEQVTRLAFSLFFVVQWQVFGILMAYILSALLKIIAAWVITGRVVLRLRFNIWQSIVAPTASALIVYNLWWSVGDFWWQPTPASSLRLLFVSLLPAWCLYGFLTGFLGGWDDEGLLEFRRAVMMSHLALPLGLLLYYSVWGGVQVSFLHGRFPIALRTMAQEEAHALTLRRKPVR